MEIGSGLPLGVQGSQWRLRMPVSIIGGEAGTQDSISTCTMRGCLVRHAFGSIASASLPPPAALAGRAPKGLAML